MILVDFHQIAIANASVLLNSMDKDEFVKEFPIHSLRFAVLRALKNYNTQYKSKYGELVIASDGDNYWRKDIFQYYKYHRRVKANPVWDAIHKNTELLVKEFKQNSIFKVMRFDKLEADDIIAILSLSSINKTLIVSADKDFQQLQNKPFIFQIDPIRKNFIKCERPKVFLKELIIKGDKSDGIPNVLSADDCFVTGVRQRSIFKKDLDNWIYLAPDKFLKEAKHLQWYQRNKSLIAFSEIPAEYTDRVTGEFAHGQLHAPTREEKKRRNKSYFEDKKFETFVNQVEDFL